ncbi:MULTISPECIES: rhombosortase-dependent M36 family metallopeptidase [unclassified Colwellia]|uniref:rhombosortase-dependent M36 family metallopeptidase n=1 Tax=unclassified Colwellia TaxID=196834 RepID=UPI0015F5396A|nr:MULTISPECIES: rhombosortase-dependent M36 family metallopeptidase [unclassified Colwellia]MBA6350516.1 rhombosortase-dependent M36 family metallopeptidase [Colwellia sp. BRX9-1]MBA6355395.1 rhombosortase-dependent M36 family metallopeptidase [Colwellia sp. BRX8-3]MBA6358741.1 rhombosortase-dependent M36 family metallopeptidase [Colwellia sp. BRX8-6]MBA6367284.1 rhombosortase-dependent M36 family metallopeptidase [Colwellia sp. BRX8-5]MBA6373705.1 rhombosortase-dependent M36 family metallope
MNFNKSIIATFVGSAIASASMGALASDASTVVKFSVPSVSNQVASVSGMSNQYDAQLGQNTFQWANVKNKAPNIGAISSEHQVAYASEFYLNQLTGISTVKKSGVQAVLASVHDKGVGAKIAKYKQEVNGVEVFNREYNIMMDAEFNLVASSGYLANKASSQRLKSDLYLNAFGSPVEAIKAAFTDLSGDSSNINLSVKETAGKYTKFNVSNSEKALGEPRAKQVFFEQKGQLIPAYYVEVESALADSVDSEYFSYVISANNGKVLFKNDLSSHADNFNYRVYADEDTKKPWDSPHGNVIPAVSADTPDATAYLDAPMLSLVSAGISTGDAWLADDATTTDGNNVKAYVDAIAPDGFTNGDIIAELTSTNTFDYKYDTDLVENSIHNRKAATVNLFYLNNYLHDDFYDHGFDEASGNAQNFNYERGGVEGDALLAEVQDNSGFNNANMSTPADGGSPRMQMYLFDSKDAVNGTDYGVTVTSHDDIGLAGVSKRSSFGQGQFNIAGSVVRIDDAMDVITDGCQAAANPDALMGKIAIIDRGTCNFTVKVKNAQDVGAIAVIVVNNVDDGATPSMGGSDDAVTIPNMGINFATGAAIYAKLTAAEDVTISMFNNKPYKGSSFDNGIVAHEWGHYISNRLVGNGSGLSNNQGRSMGEGWGDFHALLLLSDADDAMIAGNEMFGTAYSATSYVANFQTGIRNYPYSTDMEINPLTFDNVTLGNGVFEFPEGTAEVHDAGEPWAAMLWDSYVALINDERHTFAEAKSLMKDYLVGGYKMTPVAPTYTEARDAVLAAAYANDPADYDLILAAFARRGMGLGAVSPARDSIDHTGVVESYDVKYSEFAITSHTLNSNYEGLTSGYCSNDNILDKGETGTVSFTIQNRGSEIYTDVVAKIEVVGDHDITLANEGMTTFARLNPTEFSTSVPIELVLNDAMMSDSIELKVTFPELEDDVSNEYSFTATVNYDFADRAPVSSSSTDTMEDISLFKNWTENVMTGGEFAVGTQSFDNGGNIPFFASFGFDLGEQTMVLGNNSFQSDVAVETKAIQVGYAGNFEMSFWHFYGLEEGWDGGVVEISVNGGDWADVTEMGGRFDVGYTVTLDDDDNEVAVELVSQDSQALSGRPVFTGRNNDVTWGNMERVNFGTTLNGSEVKLRFRVGTDSYANDFGWWIDNVQFSNITSSVYSDLVAGDSVACDNRAPIVTAVTDVERIVREGISVSMSVEATDPNGDALTYSWEQTSGPTVTLAGSNTAAISFTSPSIESGSETLTFVASVNDGTVDATQSFSVVVNDMPSMVPARKDSSGGSTGLLAFLLLPLALLRRRKK